MKWIIPCFSTFFLIGCSADDSSIPSTEKANKQQNVIYQKGENISSAPIQQNHKRKTSSPENQTLQRKSKILLNVPLVKQNPELKYGCEIASLTMVLQFAGKKVDKLQLAKEIKKDNDPIKRDKKGNILSWGDPDQGFVGDMSGRNAGYAVFDKPIIDLMQKYLPGRSLNLTGKSFDAVLNQINNGQPVIVWTTGDYRLPDRWEEWKHQDETIRTPLDLHAVVLVGYNEQSVYLNDPLSGKKSYPVKKEIFIPSWKALQKRAVSYQ
ncbi:C39 family peptidase [Neobacillus novalis]|uniref:C39 family peptidase n=1 Tax=Neobacillus novalis TaxID=220687 RepID=A0AA95ML20_9BACI|nr:C39 family peptidase [Neobacillus novalis]WHY85909.1 C39 family peptidase [Neobacillus novalis]